VSALNKILSSGDKLGITTLHAFYCQRTGVLDLLFSDAAPARVLGGIIFFRGPGVNDTTWSKYILEIGKILLWGVIHMLRLFIGIEVIQIAVELVETVRGGQEFVFVAEVVFAELACDITKRL